MERHEDLVAESAEARDTESHETQFDHLDQHNVEVNGVSHKVNQLLQRFVLLPPVSRIIKQPRGRADTHIKYH